MAIEKTALVIDDDNICLTLLSELLDEERYKVATFSRPTCYMTLQETDRCPMETPCYNVLLTDNQMPGMTGLEFLEMQRCKGCKIPDHHKAIISGSWTRGDLDKAAQLGCQVFHKPYAFNQIITWLEASQEKNQQPKR
ncbi:MAG: hypothetical protein BA864_14295 [Desulfuromonadales bacterium C00003093]|nr:MAG: hypothetical protein BA864_14295 [Desulfuromonadales bacterium C00003093]